ncbi:type IV toxin-antitoxin system AbiEi family antitoxin domain-containing protein [Nocardiopsis sp. RSe5-2]|uniref:Type IV toxin-antitoxin system AbiEi family antitoxin domain-containing protein n=1 Tax=Nocardiopsis endophytica TaxID=3018445 RepID=A0ABT4TXS6_9ACTN|nr:type IV toxin-antitoxin system AbiEi family antitoxin domain-containing protein [Nocardiopsis endophytica]MDA2809467.1 type IV toxin-antitoxin system AbiEi family antitoxin domain-containing protein [Nocardiopsis endophytica]
MGDSTTGFDRVRSMAAQQNGLVRAAQLRECGLEEAAIRHHLRRGNLTRAFGLHGVYLVPALVSLRSSYLLRAHALQLSMGPGTVLAGRTAALLWGIQGVPYREQDTLVVWRPTSHSRRDMSGVQVLRGTLDPEDVMSKDGVRVTSPERTLRDTVLCTDRDIAVSLMDSAINLGLVRADRLPALEAANKGRMGQRRTAPWWRLADGRAQSPLETRIRLVCVDAGLPPDDLQHPLLLPGGQNIFGDLWWDTGPVLVEADGANSHAGPSGLFHDQHRQNALLAAYPGLKLLRFSWKDLSSPNTIVATIANALNPQ